MPVPHVFVNILFLSEHLAANAALPEAALLLHLLLFLPQKHVVLRMQTASLGVKPGPRHVDEGEQILQKQASL